MTNKETIIPGFPKRIEPHHIRQVCKSRKDWQKAVQKHLEHYRQYDRREETQGLLQRYDYDAAMIKRRTRVLLDSIDTVYRRYNKVTDADEHPNDLGGEWLRLNLNFSIYSALDAHNYILHAASIWILDKLDLFNLDPDVQNALFLLLPSDPDVWEYISAPDTWDTQYHEDLIASVQYVLHFRNADDGAVEEDGFKYERVITDSLTAEDAHHKDTAYRKNFDALMAMIPQEAKEQAVKNFEDAFWAWSDRFFTCIKPLVTEEVKQLRIVEQKAARYNEVRDELHERVLAFDRKQKDERRNLRRMEQKGKRASSSALLNTPVGLPDLGAGMRHPFPLGIDYASASQEMQLVSDPDYIVMMRLSDQLDKLADEYDEAIDKREALTDKKHDFIMRVIQQGYLSKTVCEEEFGQDVAEAMIPLEIADPFELCFALLWLVDQGSDLPWLYGVGAGMMTEVTESLPWGVIEYSEDYDEVVFGDAEAENPSAMPDWYDRSYEPKKGRSAFRRSLAQLVYEATGCIMPRDMHRFDSELKNLGRYGVRGKDALMLLACMTVLSHTRRRPAALNFDTVLRRMLSGDEEEEEYDTPDEAENGEKTAGLREEVKQLKAALHDAEESARDIRKELAALRHKAAAEHRELADIREIIFKQDLAEEEAEEDNENGDLPYTVQRSTLIFGGHATWEKALKSMLAGSVRFIPRDLVFDISLVRHAEVIWIQTNAISHSQYYRIVDTARLYNKPIRYFTFASAAKCARQLMEND